MPDPVRRGLPALPGLVVPSAFTAPAADSRITLLPEVPFVPVRGLLASALSTDTTARDILWLELGTPDTESGVWEVIASALGAEPGDDAHAAALAAAMALTRSTLVAFVLPQTAPSTLDARLLDLLASAPQLALAVVFSGRRPIEALARSGPGAVVVSPAAMVASPSDIASAVGFDLSAKDCAELARTPLSLPDLLYAVTGSVGPDLVAGRSDAAAVLLGEAEYLLTLRLRAAPDLALGALLPLAVPRVLTASGGIADERQLDRAAQARVLTREPGSARYRLAGLLRSTLLDELRSRLPEAVRELEARLGAELLAGGDVAAALEHLTGAGDWDGVVDAIDSASLDLLGDEATLHSVILGLPRPVRENNPRLGLLLELGWSTTAEGSPARLVATRKASAALTRLPDVMSDWDRAHAALLRTLVSRSKGDFPTALASAQTLDGLLTSDDLVERPTRMLAEAHYQAGVSRLLGLDVVGARESFTRSYDLAAQAREGGVQVAERAAEAAALTRALEGEAGQAAAWLARTHGDDSGTAGLAARALVAIGRLDARDARHWLARLAELQGDDEFWVFAVHASNRYGLYWGDPVETDADLDRTWAERGDQLVDGSTAHVLLTSDAGDLALLLGHLARAEAALDQCTVRNTWISVTRARLALLAGNPKHAMLFILEGQGRGRSERYGQLDLAVLRAATELALGRADDAAASLLRAINQSEKSGVIVPFHLLPVETLRDLADLHPDAARFVQRHGLRGTSYLAPYQAVAGALSERELVVLRALDPGATIEQIAKKLFVASNTVKAQLRSIYRKLGVSTRTEALLVAAELGLLGEDSRTA